ncbi:Uncharacterized protein QTN25_005412 [Entamoeba marina]
MISTSSSFPLLNLPLKQRNDEIAFVVNELPLNGRINTANYTVASIGNDTYRLIDENHITPIRVLKETMRTVNSLFNPSYNANQQNGTNANFQNQPKFMHLKNVILNARIRLGITLYEIGQSVDDRLEKLIGPSYSVCMNVVDNHIVVHMASGHRIVFHNLKEETKIFPPLHKTSEALRVAAQFGNICVQELLEKNNSEEIEYINQITHLFRSDISSISSIPNGVNFYTQNHIIQITLSTPTEYLMHKFSQVAIGAPTRTIFNYFKNNYVNSKEWCLEGLAQQLLPTTHASFLSQLLLEQDFNLFAIEISEMLTHRLNGIKLKGPIDEATKISKMASTLLHLVDGYLKSTFNNVDELQFIKKQLQRIEAVANVPSFIDAQGLNDNELRSFSESYLSVFLHDQNIPFLQEFFVNVCSTYEGRDIINNIPQSIKNELLPIGVEKRIQAIQSLQDITSSNQKSVKSAHAQKVVEALKIANSGHLLIAKELVELDCLAEAAFVSINAAARFYDDTKIHAQNLAEIIQKIENNSSIISIIVTEIMKTPILIRNQLLMALYNAELIEKALSIRGIESFIVEAAPHLLWKVKLLQGDPISSIEEVIKFTTSPTDVYIRQGVIRQCLSIMGGMNTSQLIMHDDLLRCQIELLKSIKIMLNKSITNGNDQTNINHLESLVQQCTIGVFILNDLAKIAGELKIYDVLLMIYVHFDEKKDVVVRRLMKVCFHYMLLEGQTNFMLKYSILKEMLGRYSVLLPNDPTTVLQMNC